MLREKLNEIPKGGGEYVGTVVSLSVELGDSVVRYSDIKQALENSPTIPDSWIPSTQNKVKLYLDVVNRLKNSGSLKYFEPWKDLFPFSPDEHQYYAGWRTNYERNAKFPCEHRILQLRQGEKLDEDNPERDLKAARSIKIRLERVSGKPSLDNTTSQFAIHYPSDTPDEYLPFINALHHHYQERLNHKYDSGAIRALILELLRGKLHSETVTSSMYLVDAAEAEQLNALSQALSEVHSGIQLYKFHVYRYPNLSSNHPANDAYNSTADGVTKHLLKDVKEFFGDLKGRIEDTETNTRQGTWERRAKELGELQDRIDRFKARNLLATDTIDEIVKESKKIIRAGILSA